jgi:endonuclease/exonuclease/phosphatase family metal-dependent hydrolase
MNNEEWTITNVYGPTSTEGRALFTNWLLSLDPDEHSMWMFTGDFNIMRSPSNRNRPGGDHNHMLLFNNIIQHLDLEEIPLKGRSYSWSNMQDNPLLERIDWIFTSAEWTSKYPDTMAIPLAKLSSDHIPIQIKIGSNIPVARIFRFEEFWTDFEDFNNTVVSN